MSIANRKIENMDIVLKIGEQDISSVELYPLLAQYRLLPQLAKQIIIDQAIASITCTPEESTVAKQRFYQKQQIADENQLKVWLDHHGMTPEQLEKLTVRDLKIEKFKQLTWADKLDPYFVKCKGQLDRVLSNVRDN